MNISVSDLTGPGLVSRITGSQWMQKQEDWFQSGDIPGGAAACLVEFRLAGLVRWNGEPRHLSKYKWIGPTSGDILIPLNEEITEEVWERRVASIPVKYRDLPLAPVLFTFDKIPEALVGVAMKSVDITATFMDRMNELDREQEELARTIERLCRAIVDQEKKMERVSEDREALVRALHLLVPAGILKDIKEVKNVAS